MKNKIITHFEYRVRPGDTLISMVHKLYGISMSDPRYAKIKASLLALNPQITNPNFIKAGTTIRIALLSEITKTVQSLAAKSTQRCMASAIPFSARVHDADWNNYWTIAWLEHNHDYVSMPFDLGISSFGNLMSEGNKRLMTSIGESYAEYLAGKITKGQYDYARRSVINQLKSNIGPAENILFGDKTPNEALRIARAGGVPATEQIAEYADKIDRLSRITRYGGYLLYAVNGAFAYEEIEHTSSIKKKNDIAIYTTTSTAIGVGIDIALDIALATTPVGWIAALVIAGTSAAISYGAGKGMVAIYNRYGHHYNFVHKIGTEFDKLWRHL